MYHRGSAPVLWLGKEVVIRGELGLVLWVDIRG